MCGIAKSKLKDRLLELLWADNPRAGVPTYWGLIIVGGLGSLTPLFCWDVVGPALSLWRKGASMETLTPSGHIGRLMPLHSALGFCFYLLCLFLLMFSILLLGITAYRAHRKAES